MKKILNSAGKSIFTGSMFSVGILVVILGVSAFESLSTTPGTAGNQSLGSQILSIASGGGFDRTTDSLEALSNKISANETKIDTNSTKLDTNSTKITTVDTKVTTLGGDFEGCETKYVSKTYNSSTLTCSAGKSIRSHAFSCSGSDLIYTNCGITSMTTTSISGNGLSSYVNNNRYRAYYSASILCCNN